MSATPSVPSLRRITPGRWAAIAWLAGLLFTVLLRVRLPGQEEADVVAGVVFLRWDGLVMQVVATALALRGSALLTRRPAAAVRYLLGAAVVASTPLSVMAIPFAQYLAVDVALYAIAATRPPQEAGRALVLSLGTLAAYLAVRVLAGWDAGTTSTLAVALAAAVAWLLGRSERQSRAYAEQARAQAATQAVTSERLRIAREMHDSVAHSIGIVALQAGAARRVMDRQPEQARQALTEIETASRETLAGLRRMLGALRTEAAAEWHTRTTEGAGLPDMPGLAVLDRLAEVTAAAGVRVAVHRVGAPRALPQDIDLSAFRVVQESVTNVVRHSGADACTVTVDQQDPDTLVVTVEDRGPDPHRDGDRNRDHTGPPAPAGSGYGLVGMRERVTLLHGEFAAGPRPGGGFRVTARLPLPTGATPR
ncbi:sensor histidine kinase [Streptomyces sp. NBC_00233]|uniref:sensor histidine kinase n=1 Tax=Streptomyces sp. NBC_00233 TaxID=2975686 RepID=UPI00224D3E1C|nr:sensor histidine kinase [Streptomyces sp. NBC_00233]MCX5231003.1 sensor histidine kinase [Streptomyces sp. NBC_00233]